MRRLRVALLTTAVAVAGLHHAAAQEAAIPDEIIKELNGLVGTWKSEGKLGGEARHSRLFRLRCQSTSQQST